MKNVLLVFVGGGAGSVVRYGMSWLFTNGFRSVFPWATLASNLLSCVVMGLAAGYFMNKVDNVPLRMLLLTGFCGGFSTFSAFSFETVELMRTGQMTFAVLNVAVSITVCFLAIYFLSKSNLI